MLCAPYLYTPPSIRSLCSSFPSPSVSQPFSVTMCSLPLSCPRKLRGAWKHLWSSISSDSWTKTWSAQPTWSSAPKRKVFTLSHLMRLIRHWRPSEWEPWILPTGYCILTRHDALSDLASYHGYPSPMISEQKIPIQLIFRKRSLRLQLPVPDWL